ncbi:MAG: FHA domain-containing protein [Hyphomicrobiaceae bacterium]|nr:FHA domain-containing protein [Hyphomicrobiaceae bacterium]
MSSDPPGGDDMESRKTRFVPRADIIEGEKAAADRPADDAAAVQTPGLDTTHGLHGGAAVAEEPPSSPVAGGTVIGRTRLVGNHAATALAAGASPEAGPGGQATFKMGGAPVAGKTEYIRAENTEIDPVAGWVVVVKGPGRGGFRPVFVGMNSVGRDDSQRVCLNFGDDSISREEHAFITYDDEQRVFYLQHGGKSNLVRLGEQPVLMPAELKANDVIRIGKTVLRFFPCCGPGFSWSDEVADA